MGGDIGRRMDDYGDRAAEKSDELRERGLLPNHAGEQALRIKRLEERALIAEQEKAELVGHIEAAFREGHFKGRCGGEMSDEEDDGFGDVNYVSDPSFDVCEEAKDVRHGLVETDGRVIFFAETLEQAEDVQTGIDMVRKMLRGWIDS